MLVIDFILDISQIVLADIVLSGDNALIIGMAAASFAEKDRKKIIFFGLLAAALLRILFALLASYLITIPGLLLVGALLLYWVCFKFYQDIKEFSKSDEENKEDFTEKVKGKSMKNALITITIADISMSLDNVIAVTAIARDQTYLLMFGIGFSILLIARSGKFSLNFIKKFFLSLICFGLTAA